MLIGGWGNDRIGGTSGNDTLYGDEGMDSLYGGKDRDLIFAGADWDKLWGNEGNDSMSGDGGNDSLLGADGDDILVGGNGHDTLNGGSGSDIYVLENNTGKDILESFQNGVDFLGLSNGLSFDELTFNKVGGSGTEIRKGEKLLATISNVQPDSIDESDFATGQFEPNLWS